MTDEDGKRITVTPQPDGTDFSALHQFTASGLNNYWLAKSLFVAEEIDGETYYSYPHFEKIMAAIGLYICGLPRILGPLEVKFLRLEIDVSQKQLGHELGYRDEQIISRAESHNVNRHAPLQKAEDTLLRFFYLRKIESNTEFDDYLRQDAAVAISQINADLTPVSAEASQENLLVA